MLVIRVKVYKTLRIGAEDKTLRKPYTIFNGISKKSNLFSKLCQ